MNILRPLDVDLKKNRVTFKRKHENKQIKELLRVLYSRIVGKDHKGCLKIEQALMSLAKYPLPLTSGDDCFILKGFDKNMCRLVDQVIFQSKPVFIPPYETSEAQPSEEPMPKRDNDWDMEVPQQMVIDKENNSDDAMSDEGTVYTEPESDKDLNVMSRKNCQLINVNSEQMAVIFALYRQRVEQPSRPALTKNELVKAAINWKQQLSDNDAIESWSFLKVLEKKSMMIKMQTNENGVVEYLATELGMEFGEAKWAIWEKEHALGEPIGHKHNKECKGLGCTEARLNPPRTKRTYSNSLFLEMLPGTYEVIMIVDKNEPDVLAKSTARYPVESRSLKVGDITWIARDKARGVELVLPHIVERKRIDDLAASIKDRRFHEQKFRLRKCGLRNVYYFIENHPSKKYCGLPEATLEQAMMNTRMHDGFIVHRTDSLKDTRRHLDMMTDAIKKELEGLNLRGSDTGAGRKDLMTFDYFNALALKTKRLTVREHFIKMLIQLKGLSVEKALAITQRYSSPAALMMAYDNCDAEQGPLLLCNLKYDRFARRVGPVVSKTIYMLFNEMDCENQDEVD